MEMMLARLDFVSMGGAGFMASSRSPGAAFGLQGLEAAYAGLLVNQMKP